MIRSAARSAKNPRLTPIETEIVLQIVAGHTARRAALDLHITEDQVQNHLLAIFEKTGCDTATQLAAAWTLYGQDGTFPGGCPEAPERAALRQEIALLTVERNALRDRVRELQQMVDYLSGRDVPRTPDELSADLLRIERDALRRHAEQLQAELDARPPRRPSRRLQNVTS